MLTRNRKLVLAFLGLAVLSTPPARAGLSSCVHHMVSCSGVGFWITQEGSGTALKGSNTSATPLTNSNPAVQGDTNGTGAAVLGTARVIGVEGVTNDTGGPGMGVLGVSNNGGVGVVGSTSPIASTPRVNAGVAGESLSAHGVEGDTQNGAGVFGYSSDQNGPGIAVYGNDGGAAGLAGRFDGNVLVNGNVSANQYNTNSDARLKTNITPIGHALQTVRSLQGVSFQWRNNNPVFHMPKTRQLGFVAQDVEQVLPELVSKDKQGMRLVAYQGVIPVLVEAIKQQQKEIDSLKAQIGRQAVNGQ